MPNADYRTTTSFIHTTTMIATSTASSPVVYCLLLLLLHSLHPSVSALILSGSTARTSVAALRSTNNDDNNMSGDLKRILVTGANTGIGLALTKQLVSEYNCHVYLGSRNPERGAAAVEEVKKCTGKDSVELLTIVSSSSL
jgi:NADPH:quinone reductase-like Zn-dependent oxidoreductase